VLQVANSAYEVAHSQGPCRVQGTLLDYLYTTVSHSEQSAALYCCVYCTPRVHLYNAVYQTAELTHCSYWSFRAVITLQSTAITPLQLLCAHAVDYPDDTVFRLIAEYLV
jgi:hypothetical protein